MDEFFEDVFNRLGPRFSLERTLLRRDRALEIRAIEQQLQQDALDLLEGPHVAGTPLLAFFESCVPQASAIRHRGRHLIAISTETFFLLERFFSYAASSPELFSRFPLLHSWSEHMLETPLEAVKNPKVTSSYSPGRSPRSGVRQALARTLLARALRYIGAHEAAHIRLGHLEHPDNHWMEDGAAQPTDDSPRDVSELKRAMEIAADRQAAASIAVTYIPKNSELLPHFLLLSLFAVLSALRLFFAPSGWPDRLGDGDHPVGQVRSLVVLAEVAAQCQERNLLDRQSFARLAEDIFVEVHQCHARISGRDDWSQAGDDLNAFRPKAEAYVERLLHIHDRWNRGRFSSG